MGRRDRLKRVENQAAAFAAKEFIVGILEELLKDVRQDAHAAAAALAVASVRERDAVMALGDAFVEIAQIFGDGRDGGLALREGRVQLFFLGGVLRVQVLTLGSDGLLRLLERDIRGFQTAVEIFSGHHDFELAVLGLGDFRFGVGDFVLQRFVGFVGFYRAALLAVFTSALFPLLPVG